MEKLFNWVALPRISTRVEQLNTLQFTSKQHHNNDADDPFENVEREKECLKEMKAIEEAPMSVSGYDDSEMQQRARKEKEIEEM